MCWLQGAGIAWLDESIHYAGNLCLAFEYILVAKSYINGGSAGDV